MPKGGKKRPKSKAIDLSEEEQELFLNAFYQGEIPPKKLKAKEPLDDNLVSSTKMPGVDELSSLDNSDAELFLKALEEGVFETRIESSTQKQDSQPVKHQAKKRDFVDGTIDLHGMYEENAIDALIKFISQHKRKGSRKLLVVHGKGSGILMRATKALIKNHPDVSNYQVAPAKLGGAGAVIVWLKRPK